ncbi:MAG: cell division ATP-binding protein FtsE [Oscillospiraceae bacterium]|nr:cell division ATP-binding protein FtsE [Oscillospiraceae bacterium]
MIELRNVSVVYPNGAEALKDVSLKINDGEFVFIVGGSGAGKSTLIKLLLKEISPNEGLVLVNGFNLNNLKKNKAHKLRRKIGFVFQDFKLINSMTAEENVAFVLRSIDAPVKWIRNRVPYVLSLVGLKDKVKRYPGELSGGEQQRVAMARALVNDPMLIIADEPTGNLDPTTSWEIIDLLQEINRCGTTVLMVTHEHEFVRHFGGRTIKINEGRVVFDDYI